MNADLLPPNPLHRLLDRALRWPPEYAAGLSNHLPMAAQALHALGADAARLAAFAERYAQRFDTTVAAAAPVPPERWVPLRGTPDGHAPLLAYFSHALAVQGRDAVLRAALPDLVPGLAAAGFHGPIRVAHALQAGHDGELAAALAYWAWRWQPLPAPRTAPLDAPLPFDAWSQQLVAQALGWTCAGRLFSIRMQHAAVAPPYAALAGRLTPAPAVLRQLSGFAAERYAATRNLVVLHMLTVTRAWRVLQPWLAAADAVPPVLLHALTAAYLAAHVPRGLSLPAPLPLSWHAVVAAALRIDDDHTIKLVHACSEEAAVYGEGPYLAAARRALA